MTPEEIARLGEVCNKATPGPWQWDGYDRLISILDNVIIRCDAAESYEVSAEDAAFFVEARTALPHALDEIERLRGALTKISTKVPYFGLADEIAVEMAKLARQALEEGGK